jgi:CheY-like chemotaxis protein
MDCHLPVFDGFEATTAIRRWEQEQGRERTPIVAVSASAFAEDREKCVATGMDDFLAKPITLAGLSGMLEKWLGVSAEETSEPIAESSAQLDSVLTPIQELAVVTELVTTPLSDGDSVEDLFDRAQLDEAQSLLGDAFGEVVGQLDGNAKEAFAGLRDALDKGDADRFRGYAHKFKGSLSTLGALTASKAALALELIGREGNLSEAPRLITDLQVLYDRSYRHLVSLSAGTASATAKSA